MVFRKNYSSVLVLVIIILLLAIIYGKRSNAPGRGKNRYTPPADPRREQFKTCPLKKKCTKPFDCKDFKPGSSKCNKCLPNKRVKRMEARPTGVVSWCGMPSNSRGNSAARGNGEDPDDRYDASEWDNWFPPGFRPFNVKDDVYDRRTRAEKFRKSIWYKGATGPAVLKVCISGYCTSNRQCQQMAVYRHLPKHACGICHRNQAGGRYGTCGHRVPSDRVFKRAWKVSKFLNPDQQNYGLYAQEMGDCPNFSCRNDQDCKEAAQALQIDSCGRCWAPFSNRCGKTEGTERAWDVFTNKKNLWEPPQSKPLTFKHCTQWRKCSTHQNCTDRATASGVHGLDCGKCHATVRKCMLSPSYKYPVPFTNRRRQRKTKNASSHEPQTGGINLAQRKRAGDQPMELPQSLLDQRRAELGPQMNEFLRIDMICSEHEHCTRDDQSRQDSCVAHALRNGLSEGDCGYCNGDNECDHGGGSRNLLSDKTARRNNPSSGLFKPFFPELVFGWKIGTDASQQSFWRGAVNPYGAFAPDMSMRPRGRPLKMAKCNIIWCNSDADCVNGAEKYGLRKGECGRWCSLTTNRCERPIGNVFVKN
ncbi:hypothetical protein Ddc_18369 [Ditylenchus destructor]|nr:hypothetical protein Ddc_18369 [Ditylenchus destructor]